MSEADKQPQPSTDEIHIHPFPVVRALHDRLWQHGPTSLSDAELLALLIRTGTKNNKALDIAHTVLHQCGGTILHLAAKRSDHLLKMPGLSRGKAGAIVAAMEMGRRRHAIDPSARPKVSSSYICYEMLKPVLLDLLHEELWALYLDRGGHLIARQRISSGGMDSTVADPKVIFNRAMVNGACAIVVGHNHPSGDLRPSAQDLNFTKKIKEGAELLDILLMDHLIVTNCGYYSFADSGKL